MNYKVELPDLNCISDLWSINAFAGYTKKIHKPAILLQKRKVFVKTQKPAHTRDANTDADGRAKNASMHEYK